MPVIRSKGRCESVKSTSMSNKLSIKVTNQTCLEIETRCDRISVLTLNFDYRYVYVNLFFWGLAGLALVG